MNPGGATIDISVIVATYDRPASLARCLESLLCQQLTRGFEIIVVDNHPQSGATAAVIGSFPAVRWLQQSVPGLSRARNFGIAAARAEIIVTTDDDVIAPPNWIERLTAPLFASTNPPAATTGNCLPWKVETEAEVLFEAYGGLRHGDERVDFDADWMRRWRVCFPQLWRIGTTANAAFRASLFQEPAVSLFETRLGAGTSTGAWEDLYCFYRILKAGYWIAYLPDAQVFHAHREEKAELARQICGYRRGETAFLTLILLRHRDARTIGQMLFWIPCWRATLLGGELLRRLRGRRKFSLRLFWQEAIDYFTGPWSLWRAHQTSRLVDRNAAAILEIP